MMKKFFRRIKESFYFHFVRKCLAYRPSVEGKQLYLTFDDGPEPGITEFILNELSKYNAKGTFFCCGKNMEKNRDILNRIMTEGHMVANHTYSHVNGLQTPVDEYVADVKKVDLIYPTVLFRPPWGQMNIQEYLRLKKRIVLWDVVSGDVDKDYDKQDIVEMWKKNVKSGSIILFHFSKEHAERTKDLLPSFLELFSKQGYIFDYIK